MASLKVARPRPVLCKPFVGSRDEPGTAEQQEAWRCLGSPWAAHANARDGVGKGSPSCTMSKARRKSRGSRGSLDDDEEIAGLPWRPFVVLVRPTDLSLIHI